LVIATQMQININKQQQTNCKATNSVLYFIVSLYNHQKYDEVKK